MPFARSAFSAALVAGTVVLAAVPALGSGRPPAARAATADAMIQKINQVRGQHGLRPLRGSGSLAASSQRFAEHLMRQDVLQHRSRPSTSYANAGEVLSLHMGKRPQVGPTVGKWMRSPSHRSVLLSSSFRQMGAGVARGRFGRARAVIWVVQVGRR